MDVYPYMISDNVLLKNIRLMFSFKYYLYSHTREGFQKQEHKHAYVCMNVQVGNQF